MEPRVAVAGVTDVNVGAAEQIRDLYVAAYPRLVQTLSLVCGNRADAEEVVQEAFVRLVAKWPTVGGYDDPEAWARLVAFRLAASRWQRARHRLAAARKLTTEPRTEPLADDRVDTLRALATLPINQRQVVVLHHMLDLPVEQVAAELGVPVGTVKSRLSRARATLAPLLRIEERDHV
jgi:RNA polymerase sigma-70 factor (sigma-E family)